MMFSRSGVLNAFLTFSLGWLYQDKPSVSQERSVVLFKSSQFLPVTSSSRKIVKPWMFLYKPVGFTEYMSVVVLWVLHMFL